METQLQLSENLYPTDEVIGSLVQSLLTRKSLHECMYWLWELLASTPNVAEGVIVIYRQFYASSNSNLGRYISRKVDNYHETGNKKSLADVIANLRTSKYSGTAYLITRYSERQRASTIYKRQRWMEKYPDKSNQILGAFKSRDIQNIGWHCKIHTAHSGIENTLKIIKQYAHSIGVDIYDGIDETHNTQDVIQVSSALARIIDHPSWNVRSIFVTAPSSLVDQIETHFTRKSSQYWRKLSEKRLYPTHLIMPPGIYGRKTSAFLKNASQLHWEYYCYESVLWNERFCKYGATLNHEKQDIVFPDDDCLENFYADDNCMDFDEQSKIVQDMSLHDIQIINDPLQWLNLVKSSELENSMENVSL